MGKLIWGIGINDANYPTSKSEQLKERSIVTGKFKTKKIWVCPYYSKWQSMIRRCYSEVTHSTQPTYLRCTVCTEWLTFSSFRKWMINQEWEGSEGGKNLHLDKDILFEGNKVYSPETCVFVSQKINNFLTDRSNRRGQCLLGVHYHKKNKVFTANCSNLFTVEYHYLGSFVLEVDAHLSWKKYKHEMSCRLANTILGLDKRVKIILLTRYQNFTVVEDHLK